MQSTFILVARYILTEAPKLLFSYIGFMDLLLRVIRNYEISMMVSVPVAAVTGFLRPLAGDVAAGTFKQF